MKRLFVTLISATLLMGSAAYAKQPNDGRQTCDVQAKGAKGSACLKVEKKTPASQHANTKVKVKTKDNSSKVVFRKGHKLDSSHSGQRVAASDYGKHHLRKPPKGEVWVKVDGRYVLINETTRLIISILN